MRKLALFAGAFSASVFLWRYSLWPLAAAAALLCCLFSLTFGRKQTSLLGWRSLLIFFGILFALIWSFGFYRLTLEPWEVYHKERDLFFTACVEDFPYQNSSGRSVTEVRFTDPVTGKETNGLLYLPTGEEDVLPGDRLEVLGSLYLADWVGEEEISYFSSRGSFVRFYATEILSCERPDSILPRYWPRYTARYTEETLCRFFTGDTAPLAQALLTGNKAGLEDHFQTMSRRAGLAHIFVISGMHISFLAGLITFFLGRRNRLSILLTLLLLCFFALMAGGTPSAWRAVALCASGLIAPLFFRENDPATSLLTTLMVLLMANPYAVASISLQLSFAAVAGIYLLTPILMERWKPQKKHLASFFKRFFRKARYALLSSTAVSLGAILFTTPLSAYYFGTVSLIGPVSNLLALMVVNGAFLLAAGVAVTGPLCPPAAAVMGWAGSWLLRYLSWLTDALGSLPFASFTMTSIYYAAGLVGLYGIFSLHLLWPQRQKRLTVPFLCSLLLVSCCVWFTRAEFRAGEMTVTVLDVGQGQAVVLRGGGRTILVDCGGEEYADAGHIVADYLADVGVSKIDLLVLTHYHADHANGVDSLLRRMDVEAAALPDVEPDSALRFSVLTRLEGAGAEISFITENTRIQLDESTTLNLYAPLGSGGTNEQGLSTMFSSGSYDVLITGDMNTEVEGRLVKYSNLPDIELLVVGHHGSRHSTGEPLLDTLCPETAVISVGAGNSYGHPAAETLERLACRNITIYRTDLSGTVVLHTSK